MKPQAPLFRRTALARSVLAVCSASAAVLSIQPVAAQTPPASAQTTPPAPVLQRVEVTGSNIRRTDTETASPVQVITRDEIERSGKGTVAEYLQTLTADGQGSVPTTYGRGFAGGSAAGISLRGLGANATLVLVNGRRIAPAVLADDGQRQFTDLKQIPLEAVERVEVVKDGASAIYGSDAIAGVVNIILRKGFVGTVGKVSYGRSRYGDGGQPRAAVTSGFGDFDKDGYNILFNFETGKQHTEYYRDRTDRGPVGVSALASAYGFDPLQSSNNIGRLAGNGTIPVSNGVRLNNTTNASIIGNVRNPVTLNYYSRSDPNGVGFTRVFPAAGTFCNANTSLPQTDAGGGCLVDARREYGTVLPDTQTNNFLVRGTYKINSQTEGFAEINLYTSDNRSQNGDVNAPSGATTNTRGVSTSNIANTLLGATHPDNPYFGTAARLSYLPALDIGPRAVTASAESVRILAGVKGTWDAWDYDTAFQFSQNKQTDTQERTINAVVAQALLNPTATNVAAASAASAAYRALPAGTFWRIGENAGLNSPALYAALLQDGTREGFSRSGLIDIKASREIGKIDDRSIGLAVGAEYRLESNNLPVYSGQGQNIGLGFVTYGGKRNVFGAYGEILLPVLKTLELNGAIRYDKYSDAGDSITPKIGAVWKIVPNFALRGTLAEGFRAPSFTENGAGSFTAFNGPTVNDRVRTAAGVPAQGSVQPAFIQGGNTNLKPEESQSFTFGAVWDITPKTSLTADVWQIKRKGLIVIEQAQQAVDAGRVTRDATTSQNPADPGALLQVTVNLVNAARSETSGFDLDGKHRFDLGGEYGRLTIGGQYTRLVKQSVTDPDGTKHEYAGTHGDCNITNCIGSPKDKLSASASWQFAAWNLTAIGNYRGSFSNKLEKSDTTCAQTFLNGTDAPNGCKIKSFTTVDISARWQVFKNTEIFGSIQNLFDSKPPLDSETYGAIGYNPLDYSGAQGRYFTAGLRHKF
jgi:iron complex outermembrane recepter protein